MGSEMCIRDRSSGLWVMLMYQCTFIDGIKGLTFVGDVDVGEAGCCGGDNGCRETIGMFCLIQQ